MTYSHTLKEIAELGWDLTDDIIPLQFTGLTDKNGKEIYEGDVIFMGDKKPVVVGWSKMFASFVVNRNGWMHSHWFGESCDPEDCEIVGNIYETPELLNDQ